MNVKVKELGSFECKTGTFVVSDPCYGEAVWCRGELTNVRKGKWQAFAIIEDKGDWAGRVVQLHAAHEETRPVFAEGSIEGKKADFVVGVDSGQAGIFDKDHYKGGHSGDKECDDWYKLCCDKTLSEAQAGVIPFGVVSSSGYGDGSYACHYRIGENSGEIERVWISFIDEDEYEEDEYEEDED